MDQAKVKSLKGIYVRQSTGLVREISHRDAAIFNILPAVPGAVLAIGLFWGLTVWPRANVQAALWLNLVFALVCAVPIGLLALAMPRTGGDYILNSRVLHPTVGLIGNMGLWGSSIFAAGFWCKITVTFGLGPLFTLIGISAKNQTLLNMGSALAGNHGWTFAIGLIVLILIAAMLIMGMRFTMKVQFWMFVAGVLGMVIVAIIFLATSNSSFISHWNSVMGTFTGQSDSYNYYTTQAANNGLSAANGYSWADTFPFLGVIMAFSIWSWFSINFAGEVKAAASRNHMWTMVISAIFYIGSMSLMTGLIYHTVGGHWLTAISSVGGDAYKLPMAPYYTLFAAIVPNNWFLSLIIGLTFFAWFPLCTYIQFVQPIRAMFAWAFDGLVPAKIADVSERTHTPIIATLIFTVIAVVSLAFAVFSSNFGTAIAYASVTGFVVIFMMGLSATVFPFIKRDLYRSSPAKVEIAGVPVMSILGVFCMAVNVLAEYLFIKYRGLGVPNGLVGVFIILGCAAVGIIFYAVAYFVRRAQGVDLGLSYKSIPPE